MIRDLYVLHTSSLDPARNLATEEVLMTTCPEETMILYLWQNEKTVVVGRNQNAWKECNVTLLEADGGKLVRRPSGGGAVYHDLGNLNFTFICNDTDYDLARQNDVIIRALHRYGIQAEASGRNDLLAEGRKFSGTAYYSHAGKSYEHGTLMVDVNMADVARYLTVDPDKLKSKGVDSVRSRVCNLKDLAPSVTVAGLCQALVDAAGEEYGLIPESLPDDLLPQDQVAAAAERMASWEWRFGRKFSFTNTLTHRFDWGGLELSLDVDAGQVRDVRVYSDALVSDFIECLQIVLRDRHYSNKALAEACGSLSVFSAQTRKMRDETAAWLLTASL
jgi:lipoate-protein ligase A